MSLSTLMRLTVIFLLLWQLSVLASHPELWTTSSGCSDVAELGWGGAGTPVLSHLVADQSGGTHLAFSDLVFSLLLSGISLLTGEVGELL